ncbi:MAG: tetratricopeptide repeat protein [Candidatus Susulua stagnicola]|nr:tetratricopeptide repeat protein [Candidatus Susulua stagnicola]
MRKSIILLILLLFSFEAYPFWIWSPKTQKWKNPKYAALATPYLQYKQAVKYFNEDEYKEAYEEFKKLLVNYPDAKEAAEAQYYLARCLEKFDKSYEAFLEYQKLIDSYPNSQRINEIVEREYNIGEYFLNRESKEWLGLSVYDFVEHPSIQIFRGIVDKVPYSEYAPRAQYKLGMIFFQLGRYEESRIAFQKVIDDYSDSEWAAPGKYQLALATSRAFSGADYDSSYLQEATSRLDEFIREHPEEKISEEAEDQLKVLRNKEAKKLFDTGEFYENQDQYRSSIIYYKKVVKNYPNSDYYTFAVESIEELELLIRRNLTKSEFKKQEKKVEAKAVREAKVDKRREKVEERREKIDKKREVKEAKLARKQALKDDKAKRKQEKIKEKNKIKARKKALKEEARKRKQQERKENKKKFWFW